MTPVITPEPTPTPPSIDRSKVKIRILNGTSTSGLAASAAASLKELGYSVSRTGNATNSAFLRTIIRTKTAGADLAQALIHDLASKFDATSEATLKDSDSDDAEIILGTK